MAIESTDVDDHDPPSTSFRQQRRQRVPREPRRLRILLNPQAGEKAGLPTNRTTEDDIREVVERFCPDADLMVTESEEEAIRLTREAIRQGYDAVVAAGGDGTIHTIAQELLHTETALGILPLGSVMNIARMLGIPRDLEEAARIIAEGHLRTIDVGQAKDVIFFESGSVGLNAPVFEEVQRFDGGEYRSILRAIWIAVRYRPARMVIQLDDQVIRTRALMVTIANGPYTGIGFTVAPDALVDDGLFDVSLFRRFSRLRLFAHLLRTAFGHRHYSPKIDTYRSSRVHIESVTPRPARADSEDLGSTPVTFTICPAALRVIAPPPMKDEVEA